MASRYSVKKPQQTNMLEIRGLSRGHLMDQASRLEIGFAYPNLDSKLVIDNFHSELQDKALDLSSDDDSTITDRSRMGSPTQSRTHSEDTMTASGLHSSHYWSGGNSFTTGNTTERSSVYSWGDDEFDHQASREVRSMFQEIEKMLFEGILSGSPHLQTECREWMEAFPHLRITGKQLAPVKDEGYQSLPPSVESSERNAMSSLGYSVDNSFLTNTMSLVVSGSALASSPVPLHYLKSNNSKDSSQGTDFSYLQEEIFEADGIVEEYLAYDIREMDEEEVARRYHVPRRRRLGYPPITPNACVRDAVINLLFDTMWAKIVGCLGSCQHGMSTRRKTKPLIKMLFESNLESQRNYSEDLEEPTYDNSSFIRYKLHSDRAFKYDKGRADLGDDVPFIIIDKVPRSAFGMVFNSYATLSHQRLYQENAVLPPSRGSYTPARAGLTGHHGNDITSLNEVMKISQKKLQVRAEKMNISQSDPIMRDYPGQHMETENPYRPMSTNIAEGMAALNVLRTLPSSSITRQHSARNRKGRKPARLLPLALDKSKTSNEGFDGSIVATKLQISSGVSSDLCVGSPIQPPPTAPAGWINPRLPPIGLESLNENSSLEFRKPRGRTALSRISSAVGDDNLNRHVARSMDNMARPNTTHTFRTDIPNAKRALSVTPSNFVINMPFSQGPKSSSPSAIQRPFLGSSNMLYAPYSNSPDNQTSGLAGITGIGMLGHSSTSMAHSPIEDDPRPHTTWGHHTQTRRKKTLLGT